MTHIEDWQEIDHWLPEEGQANPNYVYYRRMQRRQLLMIMWETQTWKIKIREMWWQGTLKPGPLRDLNARPYLTLIVAETDTGVQLTIRAPYDRFVRVEEIVGPVDGVLYPKERNDYGR